MDENALELRIPRLLGSFPELVELYPLGRFLDVLLAKAEESARRGPVACVVPFCRQIAVRRQARVRVEKLSEEVAAQLCARLEADEPGDLKLGQGTAGDRFKDLAGLRVVPCAILSRPVGYLLVPRSALRDDRLESLSLLTGYYLHRHEIEVGVERLGAKVMIMGCTPSMFRLQEEVERFAPLREPVLILGESGSGKEIFAQAVHVLSPRRCGPFVSVNCGAAPSDNLLQDEFFGHERGAFTGAVFEKEGCCQQADGGSLFLDEIGEMSHEMQTLLLRTLTTGEVRRIGGQRPTKVDIRVISATHQDLLQGTRERTFRADLYYRISPFQIRIPPLRNRPSDIPHLARYILFSFAQANHLPEKRLSEDALLRLQQRHSWPGNVRELENVLKGAFVTAPREVIDSQHLELDSADWRPTSQHEEMIDEIRRRGRGFWDVVQRPFMRREIRRDEVAQLVRDALGRCDGRLKTLAAYLNVPSEDYARFVSFLHRHGFRERDRNDV